MSNSLAQLLDILLELGLL